MTALQHIGNVALDDLAGEPFRDRGLPDTGIADVEWVVLRAAAQDLDGPVDLGDPPDQRVDLAQIGLLVEVDGELRERAFLLAPALLAFPRRLGQAGIRSPRPRPCRPRG